MIEEKLKLLGEIIFFKKAILFSQSINYFFISYMSNFIIKIIKSFFLSKMMKIAFLLKNKLSYHHFKFFSSFQKDDPNIISNNPNEILKEELKLDPIATSLEEYKQAMENFHTEKYQKSEELFKRTLSILKNSDQINSDTSIHILKK